MEEELSGGEVKAAGTWNEEGKLFAQVGGMEALQALALTHIHAYQITLFISVVCPRVGQIGIKQERGELTQREEEEGQAVVSGDCARLQGGTVAEEI